MNASMLDRLPALGAPSPTYLRNASVQGLSQLCPGDSMLGPGIQGVALFTVPTNRPLGRLTKTYVFGNDSTPALLADLMEDLKGGTSCALMDGVMAIAYGLGMLLGLSELGTAVAAGTSIAISAVQAYVTSPGPQGFGSAMPRAGDCLYRYEQFGKVNNRAVLVTRYLLFDPFRWKVSDCRAKGWVLSEERLDVAAGHAL